ncbi:uncharacterized transmembrane protein DDB_G0289901-like [Heteronotia binoei]|uniref:uncharacterized transmembrane protein DDB_G0289901-like n=1 Tax=Heteronotia binoei TaxID=13085 RepID=UPI0029305B26|nr:uncharacterized transmembrane protein DDB_G0289901-like [Heteronotia binoei]
MKIVVAFLAICLLSLQGIRAAPNSGSFDGNDVGSNSFNNNGNNLYGSEGNGGSFDDNTAGDNSFNNNGNNDGNPVVWDLGSLLGKDGGSLKDLGSLLGKDGGSLKDLGSLLGGDGGGLKALGGLTGGDDSGTLELLGSLLGSGDLQDLGGKSGGTLEMVKDEFDF